MRKHTVLPLALLLCLCLGAPAQATTRQGTGLADPIKQILDQGTPPEAVGRGLPAVLESAAEATLDALAPTLQQIKPPSGGNGIPSGAPSGSPGVSFGAPSASDSASRQRTPSDPLYALYATVMADRIDPALLPTYFEADLQSLDDLLRATPALASGTYPLNAATLMEALLTHGIQAQDSAIPALDLPTFATLQKKPQTLRYRFTVGQFELLEEK